MIDGLISALRAGAISPANDGGADAAAATEHRLVLLGASNLTKRINTVLAAARQCVGPPSEIFVAFGRGRSYGRPHLFLGRQLPGILGCGLWRAIDARPRVATTALVTDIGNDILYDYPVAQVADWIDECLARLQDLGAETVITRLPVANFLSLSERRFLFFRNLMIPGCRLSLATVRERAFALNDRVGELAERRRVVVVEQQADWYGVDPIHVRRSRARHAWQTIWRSLGPPKTADFPAISLADRARLARLEAAEWKLFGYARQAPQPVARLSDGATIAVY